LAKKNNTISSSASESDLLTKEINAYLKTNTSIEAESVGEHDFIPELLDTGNYALNWAISGKLVGGFPCTKVSEMFGAEGSGKSLILTKIAGENIKRGGISYIIDTEDAVNPLFAKIILNDPDGSIVNKIQRVNTIDTLEQLRNFVVSLANKKISMNNGTPIFIGIDSISQLSSEKEMEDSRSGSFARDMTKQQAMRGFFRVVNRLLRPANITLVVLSHTSAAIGAFGNPVTAANHGGGVKFASSVRIWITSSKEVADSNGIPLGVRMNFKIEKNRLVFKGRKASVNLSFKKGIQGYSGLLELLADNEIIKLSTKDIKKTTKVTYHGQEFSASKLEEWIEQNGGSIKILEGWQKALDNIYGSSADEESFEEASPIDEFENDLIVTPLLG
jgi:recombination protein RecA